MSDKHKRKQQGNLLYVHNFSVPKRKGQNYAEKKEKSLAPCILNTTDTKKMTHTRQGKDNTTPEMYNND